MKRPGQDLLAQARSGVMWLNGDEGQGPVPFGLAIGDMFAGAAAAQGILAALVRRGVTGKGAHIETSLLEALVDFQFEVLTTFLNDGRRLPTRANVRSAHAYLSAPYGVYPAKDGYLAIAMTPIPKLAAAPRPRRRTRALSPAIPRPGSRPATRSRRSSPTGSRRGPSTNGSPSSSRPTSGAPRCSTGTNCSTARAFAALDMLQTVTREDDVAILTTRSPIRVDGVRHKVARAAPRVGEHSAAIRAEFGL